MQDNDNNTVDSIQQRVLDLHAAGRLDEAIVAAEQALLRHPGNKDLLQYLGSTLVARKRRFQQGLGLLEQALTISPDDADLLYTAGWCYEFAAHEMAKGRGRRDAGSPLSTESLLATAERLLRKSVRLQSDPGLRDDAIKLLETITGEDFEAP
jgi:tetratricopeptide (TPR) repeat protein